MIDKELLFKQILKVWGRDAQILMTIEESAELIQALTHFLRGRASYEKVAEEIADVIIMSQQMRIIFGSEIVDQIINEKLIRTQSKLNKEENDL